MLLQGTTAQCRVLVKKACIYIILGKKQHYWQWKSCQKHFMVTVRVDTYYMLFKWLTLRFEWCLFRFMVHK